MSSDDDDGVGIEHDELVKANVALKSTHKIDTTVSESCTSSNSTRTTRSTLRASPDLSDEEPEQEAISMILSQIDEESYESALVYDTERILQRHVFPKSFLWNKPRIQLLRTLPRDIEDMPGVLNAGAVSPFQITSTNNGPLGFGMFDMGGFREQRGTRSETITPGSSPNATPSKKSSNTDDEVEYPLESCVKYQAAARRSDDCGVIELNVNLPPLPLETALLQCQQHNILPHDPWMKHDKTTIKRTKMLISAERMESLATMPFCWGSKEKDSKPYIPEVDDPHTYEACLDTVGVMPTDKFELYKATKRRQKRKLMHTKIAQSSFRKWRLSVRVGGVSSRTELVKNDEASNTTPMHLNATFPSYFQVGKSVSIDTAQKLDEENGNYLGSYDCRASAPHASMSYEAMRSIKKDNRAKKNINIGRTRPIWSSFHQANNNKIVYTSDLTGERLVSDAAKRPLQATVFVRLNAEIISISKEKKTKKYPKSSHFEQKIKWKEEDILQGIHEATKVADIESSTGLTQKTNEYSFCAFKPESYLVEIANGLKPPIAGKKRKLIDNGKDLRSINRIPMKYGATDILKYIPPKFNCLPLEDGFLRVVCEKSGSLQSCDVHDLLKAVSEEDNSCSVSWCTDDKKNLLTCVVCGLKVNKSCCKDEGEHLPGGSWKCPVCLAGPSIILTESLSAPSNGGVDEQQLPSRKSRRTSRLPTRFTENTEVDNTVVRKNSSRSPTILGTKNTMTIIKTKRPSPRCSLCPHSGGAMSQLDDCNSTQQWAHEICRIWCTGKKCDTSLENSRRTYGTSSEPPVTPYKSSKIDDNGFDPVMSNTAKANLDVVCAICSVGDVSKHEKRGGLIKCAAQGCNIRFHPMCATLVTKLHDLKNAIEETTPSSSPRRPKDDQIQKDIDLCTDFTLDVIEVSYETVQEDKEFKQGDSLFIARGNDSNSKQNRKIGKRIIPIGFCPLHNPKREKSFYGCTPGAQMMSDFMTVPYQK